MDIKDVIILDSVDMIIKHVNRTTNEIHYWYYNSERAERMNMKSFYYVSSWLPDIVTNVVSIEEFVRSARKDFTSRQFFIELLMLITEYQQAVENGWMSSRVFEMKIENLNYHLSKNDINIKINI